MPLVTRIPTGYDALTGEVRAWDWREVLTTEIRETMKVLIATEKPFAQKAVDGIRRIVEEAGYELALLEKYTDKAQLLEAVADVDALIIRSDKVTAEVIAAAPQLKIVVRAGAGYDNVDLAAATARGIVVITILKRNHRTVENAVRRRNMVAVYYGILRITPHYILTACRPFFPRHCDFVAHNCSILLIGYCCFFSSAYVNGMKYVMRNAGMVANSVKVKNASYPNQSLTKPLIVPGNITPRFMMPEAKA